MLVFDGGNLCGFPKVHWGSSIFTSLGPSAVFEGVLGARRHKAQNFELSSVPGAILGPFCTKAGFSDRGVVEVSGVSKHFFQKMLLWQKKRKISIKDL